MDVSYSSNLYTNHSSVHPEDVVVILPTAKTTTRDQATTFKPRFSERRRHYSALFFFYQTEHNRLELGRVEHF